MLVVLGLGSNLGDRLSFLSEAVHKLSDFVKEIKLSSIYETKAVLPDNAPDNWDIPYLNIVLSGKTKLLPRELLSKIKQIESQIGRDSQHARWAPREIDIDILIHDNNNIKEHDLIIPHNHLLNRAFFVIPMAEIVPHWKYIIEGLFHKKSMQDIAKELYGYPNLPDTIRKTDLCLK